MHFYPLRARCPPTFEDHSHLDAQLCARHGPNTPSSPQKGGTLKAAARGNSVGVPTRASPAQPRPARPPPLPSSRPRTGGAPSIAPTRGPGTILGKAARRPHPAPAPAHPTRRQAHGAATSSESCERAGCRCPARLRARPGPTGSPQKPWKHSV